MDSSSPGGFEGTRGHLIARLRESPATADDLAEVLGVTASAVRSQLTALMRDGLVEARGARRGVRRPSVLYGLTDEAEVRLSRAYPQLLDALLTELEETLPEAQIARVLEGMGVRLAGGRRDAPGDSEELRRRVEGAAGVLSQLGGLLTVREAEGGGFRIESAGCPAGHVVARHAATCRAVESLVSALVGLPVIECCDRSDRARCRFEIPPATASRR